MSACPQTHEEYTVGWICALPKEQTAAISMLDEQHADFPKSQNDANAYTLGSIGPHNVVITCLPLKCYGTNQTARAVAQMFSTFPSVKIVLMVGIGAGIPSKVKLGDVVISTEWTQWDFGKANGDGVFEHIDKRYYPPTELSSAMSKLQTDHEMHGTKISQYLNDLTAKHPRLASQYTSTGKPEEVQVHYGLIASGNQVVKDAAVRNAIYKRLNNQVLCIEMEAAGLVGIPAIIIRGVCDYADSEKNDDWQEYAAAVAAACAKEFLQCVQLSVAREMRTGKADFKKVINEIATIRYSLAREEDRKILEWITPIDESAQHNDTFNRRQPGTGEWLLTSPQYQNWLNTNKAILFCPGMPGAGKTILTSTVIDHLIDRYSYNSNVGIAYIYLNFKKSASLHIDDLLLDLLKQLARTQTSLPKCVRELHDRYKYSRPSRTDIVKTLHAITAAYSRVFIVVDALDEYQKRSEFLENLFQIHQNRDLNIFATSREIPEIRERFKGISVECEIRASDEDVREYLEGQISRLGTKVVKKNKEMIKAEISKVVQGMFLLAHLYFEEIKSAMTLKAIDRALKGFATMRGAANGLYDSTYRAIMERIREKDDKASVNMAFQVLSWITCASRPLTKAELQHAIAVEPGEPRIDEDNISEIEDLVSVCNGLVTIDEESDIVKLIHYTAQEYFERNQRRWFPNSHSDIAKICLIYLSYDTFKSGPTTNIDMFIVRLHTNALYKYAADNWGKHVRESLINNEHSPESSIIREADWCTRQIEAISLARNLLLDDNLRLACIEAMLLHRWRFTANYGESLVLGSHIAAYFGLTPLTEELLARQGADLESKNVHSTTLWVAADGGHEEVVKLLLNKGADLEVKSGYKKTTALWIAADKGHEEIVKLLLNKGADLEAKRNDGCTPLYAAAERGHEKIVKLLLSKNADLEAKRFDICTPLHTAVRYGHEEVVKLLLNKGADLEAKEYDDNTPLHTAVEQGHEEVVKLLLNKNADLEAKRWDGNTPLHAAVERGNEKVVKMLIEKGADIKGIDSFGRTPLWIATRCGHERVIKMLLEKGADIETRDENGRTPLWIAAKRGREDIVRLLVGKGADIEAGNKDGHAPLWIAAERGHERITKLLVEKGANRN
ncbi:hypothetical protein TWF730_006173 [Orbilia blumenaviensis]|uniref:Nucleoside phosphorylase domain-containing protein n=1 Tax=Orbilia blumenaviensis TaxID=1796055 RepID=A0AAV9TYQ6_9PEZI